MLMTVRKRRNTMFGTPRHKKLAKLIRQDTPTAAREAAREILSDFRDLSHRDAKVAYKRAVVLASNRAGAIQKKKNLSVKERAEFRKIQKIYRDTADKMKL
jgi:hypothetical protein